VNLQYVADSEATLDGAGTPANQDCPNIFTALPKRLGLRLESAKGAVEFLVVEHAEKPTEN
jgi:uncharacterized protein (TIGR03435 family)